MPLKYYPIQQYLLSLRGYQTEITMSFAQFERIIGTKLPQSARIHRTWWSNELEGAHVQAHAWMNAGWKVESVNLQAEWVRFVRQ